MIPGLSGATRLYVIVGDPIAQVKSPGAMTAGFASRGHDAVLVPVHVQPQDFPSFMAAASQIQNLDGIIATMPHKIASRQFCASVSPRADFLGAVNIMRRRAGGWHGEMVDGLGFVAAVKAHGGDPAAKRALLAGAGGAGSAVALALVEAGVSELAIHDADAARRDGLIGRLAGLGKCKVVTGSSDPAGSDLVCNATPAGMQPEDAYPFTVDNITPDMFVGCVITTPCPSPLVAAARELGCRTSTGVDMYQALQGAMLDFFLESNQ